MKNLACYGAFFALAVVSCWAQGSSESQSTESSSEQKLKVAVYYETLCGDSKRFIKTQLYPVKSSSLGEYFDVELVPYGKALTEVSGNTYEFSCQHGSAECEGNKMHACAIKYLNTSTGLDFIYCSMSKRSPPDTLDECSTQLGISPIQISQCAEGQEGSELLAANGEKTHALKPSLYFVPWITYNGKFTSENLQNSQSNFKAVVCEELGNMGVSPAECEPTVEKWGARRA